MGRNCDKGEIWLAARGDRSHKLGSIIWLRNYNATISGTIASPAAYMPIAYICRRSLIAFGFAVFVAAGAPAFADSCPTGINPVVTIEATTYYRQDDPTRSTIDLNKQARNRELLKPVNGFLQLLTSLSDQYLDTGVESLKKCADDITLSWAKAGALTVVSSSAQARFVQQWSASTLGFVRLKLGPLSDPNDDLAVRRWLATLATEIKKRNFRNDTKQHNNHYYWSTLGIGVIAVAIADDELWRVSKKMYETAIRDIAGDGTLPAELIRGNRAALYHAFAAQPLAAYKLLATYCQLDASVDDKRLERLIALVRMDIADLRATDKKTGIKQGHVSPQPWLDLWDALRSERPQDAGTRKSQNLGGAMNTLSQVLYSGCGKI